MIEQIVTALGLVLVIEGLVYALVPGHFRKMAETLRQLEDHQLQMIGTAAIAVGVLVIWLARGFL